MEVSQIGVASTILSIVAVITSVFSLAYSIWVGRDIKRHREEQIRAARKRRFDALDDFDEDALQAQIDEDMRGAGVSLSDAIIEERREGP